MKKFKKIITMGLAAIMAISAMSMSVFAADNISTNDNAVEIETVSFGDSGIMPLSYVYNGTKLTGNGSFNGSFTINASEPNFKVWVINNSYKAGIAEDYTVRIMKGTQEIDSFTVGSGYEWNGNMYDNGYGLPYNGYGTGSYKVIVSNRTGNPLKGTVTVRREAYALD